MALMDSAEVSEFCQDVARRYASPHDGRRLSHQACLAIEEFQLCFAAAFDAALVGRKLNNGWWGKAALLVAANPIARQAVLPEDRGREAIEALDWVQKQQRGRHLSTHDILRQMINEFPLSEVPPESNERATRRTRNGAKPSQQPIRRGLDSAPALTAFQRNLLRNYSASLTRPIPHAIGLLDGIAHVAEIDDLAYALRVSPDYLHMLCGHTEATPLWFYLRTCEILDPLVPEYSANTGLEESVDKIANQLRTLLPELDLPYHIALFPAHQALRHLVDSWRNRYPAFAKIADSTLLQSVQIAAAALHDDPVLILGPTGTGKGLSARAIHAMGGRAQGPFRAFNCASMPPALVESELFGYEKGSHSGADRRKAGLVQEASGGTLFVDEIGRAPLEVQYALLRTLSDKVIRPVGSNEEIEANVRFVFATSSRLFELEAKGVFLPDLHHRLRPDFALYLPGINQRPFEDVKEIWEDLVRKAEDDLRERTAGSTVQRGAVSEYQANDEMIKRIHSRSWPGNIRQLEYVAREIVRRRGVGGEFRDHSIATDVFRKIDERRAPLPQDKAKPVSPSVAVNERPQDWPSERAVTEAVKALALSNDGLKSVIGALENALIEEVLREVDRDRAQAAARLGLTRGALTKRMARSKKQRPSASPSISPAKP